MKSIARGQLVSARQNQCTTSGYLWVYKNHNQEADVNAAIELYNEALGRSIRTLWLDIEPYTDQSLPGVGEIQSALDACAQAGVRGGIYTGPWVWPKLNNPSFPGVWLWNANYNEKADLNLPAFGGMIQVGHQWTSTPLDRSVFLASAI